MCCIALSTRSKRSNSVPLQIRKGFGKDRCSIIIFILKVETSLFSHSMEVIWGGLFDHQIVRELFSPSLTQLFARARLHVVAYSQKTCWSSKNSKPTSNKFQAMPSKSGNGFWVSPSRVCLKWGRHKSQQHACYEIKPGERQSDVVFTCRNCGLGYSFKVRIP